MKQHYFMLGWLRVYIGGHPRTIPEHLSNDVRTHYYNGVAVALLERKLGL